MGILCGACPQHLSLSLGSSRCLPCENHWPAVLVAILIAAIVAGILLVYNFVACTQHDSCNWTDKRLYFLFQHGRFN